MVSFMRLCLRWLFICSFSSTDWYQGGCRGIFQDSNPEDRLSAGCTRWPTDGRGHCHRQWVCHQVCSRYGPPREKTNLTPEKIRFWNCSMEIFSFGQFSTALKQNQKIVWNGQDMAFWSHEIHRLCIGLPNFDPASLKIIAASIRSVFSWGLVCLWCNGALVL